MWDFLNLFSIHFFVIITTSENLRGRYVSPFPEYGGYSSIILAQERRLKQLH